MTAAFDRTHRIDSAWLDRIGWLPKPPATPFRNRTTGDPDAPQPPLYVPGFFGCPVYVEKPAADRFAHGASDWSQPCLTLREVQMLRALNELTDIHDWSVPPFLDARQDTALKTDLINAKTWDWCRRELHDLAARYRQTKFITVFDSSSRICKSDTLVPPQLLAALQSAAPTLQSPACTNRRTHDSPSDLVDPSLFPLVHGLTRVLLDGTQVPLRESTAFIGRGQVTEPLLVMRPAGRGSDELRETYLSDMAGRLKDDANKARFYRGSERFQWLPCDVQFTDEGRNGVEILSYINNLHPGHHHSLYRAIEEAISLSIEPWNEVLAYTGRPRTPPRIRTYGVEWWPENPWWAHEDLLKRLDKMTQDEKKSNTEYQRVLGLIEEYSRLPRYGETSEMLQLDEHQRQSLYTRVSSMSFPQSYWKHPEPGDSFTYDEWRKGQSGRPIIGGCERRPLSELPPEKTRFTPRFDYPDHDFYNISLRDQFRDNGLQVVVRIASIDLDQQTRNHPGTEWKVNGFLNEHIVATSLIFFDIQNVTQSSMSFRVEADLDDSEHQYEGYNFEEIAAMYGFEYEQLEDGEAIQELGQVKIVQGRMIAYPNTLQHRWDAFELAPGASAGHVRYLEMHLVDPHYRLISTANVPPQQHEWWYEAGPGRIDWAAYRMPREIVSNIANYVGEWPMGVCETLDIKREMDEERRIAMEAVMAGVVRYQFYGPL
ncbi:hypothetical protein JX265_005472 [Neoarthrinium moseri]|uniref:Uncharacterized protein n=1 Tax=Neoarthrinium moseri TaxID=1658444 RepID=A0A9P9WPA4_9PEZI|nr:hypothetical protein JX265_005472 [Neoarthrinium moseri]